MFWKKKEEEYTLYTTHTKCMEMLCELLGFEYRDGRGKIVEQNKNVGINLINKKLDLILDHLNLEYVAETEKKEPAKLVEKKRGVIALTPDWGIIGAGFVSDCSSPKAETKKKKRKYTKSGKYSKRSLEKRKRV